MNERWIVISVGIAIVGYHVITFIFQQTSLPSFRVVLRNISKVTTMEYNNSISENITKNITQTKNQSKISSRINQSITSPLHDQTVHWDFEMTRPWLESSVNNTDFTSPPPPAMLLLTNYAWNHPNQSFALRQYRGIRSAELYEGIVNHPWFHPTAWEEIQSGNRSLSNDTRYYIFLDFETCSENNYPRYGHGYLVNQDTTGGRGAELPNQHSYFLRLFQEPILSLPNSISIVWECRGVGPSKFHNAMRRMAQRRQQRLSFVSISTTIFKAKSYDQGLPPPACRKFYLTEQEEHDIQICNETSRPTLFSFSGQILRPKLRQELYELRNQSNVMIGRYGDLFPSVILNTTDWGLGFEMLAKRSVFSAAPRGDNLFSYRFSEVMACGSIPVVYADDWLLPFGAYLLNWTEAIVLIREQNISNTINILSQISMEQRCRMRQRVVEIYRKYMETGRGTVKGIIENFERQVESGRNK